MSRFTRFSFLGVGLCVLLWGVLSISSCSREDTNADPSPKGDEILQKSSEKATDSGQMRWPEGDWFVDVAPERGIDLMNETGVPGRKEFIMGAVGPGGSAFDANGDGLVDFYIPNGSRLVGGKRDRFYDGEDRPRNALYIQRPDGTFVNEAKERGVDDPAWSFGCCAGDVDNDGDLDLVVSNFGANRLYLNDGKGFFKDVAVQAGVAGAENRWSTGIGIGDYDLDGQPDLYIANYADMFKWMQVSQKIKKDDDGNILDARVCEWNELMVYCGPLKLPEQQDYLYRGLGTKDGVPCFEDVTVPSGVHRPREGTTRPLYGFQVLFTDLNGDGWPDIYVANDSVPSFFFENQGDGTFKELAPAYQIDRGFDGKEQAGMGADVTDLNGDGLPDLLKTNFANDSNNVYIAAKTPDGRILYTDLAQPTGVHKSVFTALAWGTAILDFDHDGRPDVYFANGHVYPEVDAVPDLKMSFRQRNQLFRNVSEPVMRRGKRRIRVRLDEVTARAGSGLQIRLGSRGATLCDFDRDGDVDILVVNLNGKPNLLENRHGNKVGSWIKMRLTGDPALGCARDAMGAKVVVVAGDRRQHLEVRVGQSWLGSHEPFLHAGLGAHDGPIRVEVTWPNRQRQKTVHEFDGVNREVRIDQKK